MKPDFDRKNAQILGASFDTPAENRAFREKLAFPFPLLCDTERSLGLAYGAAAETGATYPSRVTVLIGEDGKVRSVYPDVDPKSHPAQVLADLG